MGKWLHNWVGMLCARLFWRRRSRLFVFSVYDYDAQQRCLLLLCVYDYDARAAILLACRYDDASAVACLDTFFARIEAYSRILPAGFRNQLSARYDYDNISTPSAAFPTAGRFPRRFSTKYLDTDTGLYYYGRRYYSPELGRWPNRDPIDEKGGLNLYAFVMNAPPASSDLLGLSCVKYVTYYSSGRGMFEMTSWRQTYIEESRSLSLNWGEFSVNPMVVDRGDDPCTIKLALTIRVQRGLQDTPQRGVVYNYYEHYVSGGALRGGTSTSTLKPATKWHELGHARGFWRVGRPIVDAQLAQFCGRPYSSSLESQIRNTVNTIRTSNLSLLRASANDSNSLEVGWWLSQSNLRHIWRWWNPRQHEWTVR